jgi:hypothetical protein
MLAGLSSSRLFPAFHFGTGLTEMEIVLGNTLQALKTKLSSPEGA